MKTPFLLLVIILLSSCPLLSQTRIGAHWGLSYSTLTQPGDWDWRNRRSGGLTLEVGLSSAFRLATEINYIDKWAAYASSPWGGPTWGVYHATLQLSYIDVPLFLRWVVGNSPINWYIDVGPSFGFMVNKKVEWWHSYLGTWEEYANGDFRTFNFALAAGAGAEFEISERFSIGLLVHYSQEITDPFMDNRGSRAVAFQGGVQVMYTL